jgi:chromate transporter
MALWVGWRLRRLRGLFVAAISFIAPAVVAVLVLSWLLYGAHGLRLIEAAALGAAAVVPAVAARAAWDLIASYRLKEARRSRQVRVALYGVIGILGGFLLPAALPALMILCGLGELWENQPRTLALVPTGAVAVKWSLAWTALEIGALSFGGGFVIVPMLRGDAVTTHHWMTASAFAVAVAIGQLTPGPVVATIAAVGYAADGLTGGLLAAAVAFAPSLIMVGLGARHFDRFRRGGKARSFLEGAGPVATGAIVASAATLAASCTHAWQWPLVVVAFGPLLIWRRSPTVTLARRGRKWSDHRPLLGRGPVSRLQARAVSMLARVTVR